MRTLAKVLAFFLIANIIITLLILLWIMESCIVLVIPFIFMSVNAVIIMCNLEWLTEECYGLLKILFEHDHE